MLSPMSDCRSQNRQLLGSQKHFCIIKHLQTEFLFVRLSGTDVSRIGSLSLGVCWVRNGQRLKLHVIYWLPFGFCSTTGAMPHILGEVQARGTLMLERKEIVSRTQPLSNQLTIPGNSSMPSLRQESDTDTGASEEDQWGGLCPAAVCQMSL